MMTREKFVANAVRAAEKALYVPAGWWGRWTDVRGPLGERVHFSAGAWTSVRADGARQRHDSRTSAIRAARK